MNVSLPKLAANATPAKTFLPGASTSSGKFSILLAEAQDTAPSTPDVVNDGERQVGKKMSAKSYKGAGKPAGAQMGSATAKDVPVVSSTSGGSKLPLAITMPSSGSPKEPIPPTDDSEPQAESLAPAKADPSLSRGFQFQPALTDSTVAGSTTRMISTSDTSALPPVSGKTFNDHVETKKIDSPVSSADHQPASTSSTNILSTWMATAEAATPKSLMMPPAADSEASATPVGKPATAGTKAVFTDTGRGTTFALNTTAQSTSAFLSSHTAAIETPKAVVRASSGSETKREVPQGHATSGSLKDKAEKAITRALSDAQTEDFDGTPGNSTQNSKAGGSSTGPIQVGEGNFAVAPAPGSVASMQASSPAIESRPASDVALSKTLGTLQHSEPTAAAEDGESPREAVALSASSALHTAKLVSSLEHSELHMGLRAGEFGNIDIRTSLARNQFTAQISVERGELGRALTEGLPSLQHRLTEQHLTTANVTVQDRSAGGSSEFKQGPRQGQNISSASVSGDRMQEDSSLLVPQVEAREGTSRLDIHM